MDRLPKPMRAQVRRVLRQAWEIDDAGKAEQLLRNLARRLEKDWEGVSASILEGLDEMLTVTRLGLPAELRRSLACTNIIENVMGTVRRVCRNVKYWRSPSMALRWTGAAMQEAPKGFRRLKAHKRLPLLKDALAKHKAKAVPSNQRLDALGLIGREGRKVEERRHAFRLRAAIGGRDRRAQRGLCSRAPSSRASGPRPG